MPRLPRVAIADTPYHVLNRANGRATIFENDADYHNFESLLLEAVQLIDMRVLAYTIMPNHWHLLLYPRKDGDLSEFMRWLTTTHVRQHRVATKSVGHGHLYQGIYKSFPIEKDSHLLTVIRYVEQNPLRAKLVKRAEEWQWGSLYRRRRGNTQDNQLLSPLPTSLPHNYLASVNTVLHESHLTPIHYSISKGAPYGSTAWTEQMVRNYNLHSTQRGPGRPRKG